jgi:adenylate cyclase
MSDVFISYARSTEADARKIADALRALGYRIWRDDELPAHRSYAEVIEERLTTAKAVVVVWSAEAVKSEWVRSEANRAREDRKLVQLTLDSAKLPMPFDQIQCADLAGWNGDLDSPGWKKVVSSVAELAPPTSGTRASATPEQPKISVCVLPFLNMSGDPEQEYFSDGISEDIITDLSKVSSLFVVARNTAFTFKGKPVAVPQVARELAVTHVLEGSVRKSGGRVRITAQLIDGSTGGHVWAERFDRDLDDIFALQDEISQSIVKALKLKLLPEEKKAIEQRGTENPEAYNLYLMARQYHFADSDGDLRHKQSTIRLCERALELDPDYALPWSLKGLTQWSIRLLFGGGGDGGLEATERALALDPRQAEAHAVKACLHAVDGRADEAAKEIETALRLGPASFDVNYAAGRVFYMNRRLEDAVTYFEKAASLMDTDFNASGMLIVSYQSLGDMENSRRAARMTLPRAEAAVARDRGNTRARGFGVQALATLGEHERAKEWIALALVTDPDNMIVRYNFACTLVSSLDDREGAIELMGPVLEKATPSFLNYIRADAELDAIRDNPRFKAMFEAAEARTADAAAAE